MNDFLIKKKITFVIFFGNLVLNDTSMSYLYVLLYARAISKTFFIQLHFPQISPIPNNGKNVYSVWYEYIWLRLDMTLRG